MLQNATNISIILKSHSQSNRTKWRCHRLLTLVHCKYFYYLEIMHYTIILVDKEVHVWWWFYLKRLHAWLMLSIQFDHKGSNCSGTSQYWGNMWKIVVLSWYSSLLGRPGRSLQPRDVHFFINFSPNIASCAILIARVGALFSFLKVLFFSITSCIVFFPGQSSMADDGSALESYLSSKGFGRGSWESHVGLEVCLL